MKANLGPLLLISPFYSFLCVGPVYAAGDTCDFTLKGGSVAAGTVTSAKLTTDIAAPAVPAGTVFTAGSISSGTLTLGVASGGKLVATQCQGVQLQDGALTDATLTGAVYQDAAGAQQTVNVTAASLGEVKLTGATVNDPLAVLAASKAPTTTTEAKDLPLAGDWFKFRTQVDRIHLGEHDKNSPPTVTGLRAPKGACFRVATEVEKSGGTDPGKFARGTFFAPEKYSFLTVLTSPSLWFPPYDCATAQEYDAVAPTGATEKIDLDRTYDIHSEMLLTERDRYRSGFTYGVMVAPFKYYRKTRTFDAGAQVGPYIGYRLLDRPGSSTVLAFGIGATSAKVTNTAGGGSTEETKNGISWAFGVLTEFKNSFNIGLLWGMDMFSSTDLVPRNGAHWLSVSIGYKLSN